MVRRGTRQQVASRVASSVAAVEPLEPRVMLSGSGDFQKPDLVAWAVGSPSLDKPLSGHGHWGGTIVVESKASTGGFVDSGPFGVAWFLSQDSTFSPDDVLLRSVGGTTTCDSLPPWTIGPAFQTELALPGSPPEGWSTWYDGQYHGDIILVVDYSNAVDEVFEGNDNRTWCPVVVDDQGQAMCDDVWASANTVAAPTCVVSISGEQFDGLSSTRDEPPASWTALDARHPARIMQADGDVATIRLVGRGGGAVGVSDTDGHSKLWLNLAGTDSNSCLTISVTKGRNGDGIVDLNGITVSAPLGALQAAQCNLFGDLNAFGGLGRLALHSACSGTITIGDSARLNSTDLRLGEVADVNIHSLLPIRSLQAVDWLNLSEPQDEIIAPWIGSLTTTGDKRRGLAGDFQADLKLPGGGTKQVLGNVSIAGGLSQARWGIAGDSGNISIKGNIASDAQIEVQRLCRGLTIGDDLAGTVLLGTLPARAAIGGALSGRLIGRGNATVTVGRALIGLLDVSGKLNLALGGSLAGIAKALSGGVWSLDSLTDVGLAVIADSLTSLYVKGAGDSLSGGVVVGQDIQRIIAPNSDLSGWIAADGKIGTLNLAGIAQGRIAAGGAIQSINLGTKGSRGLVQTDGIINSLVSRGDISGAVFAGQSIGSIRAPSADHLSVFTPGSIGHLRLGNGNLTSDGVLATGAPVALPSNLSFTGAQVDLDTTDLESLVSLLNDTLNHLGVPQAGDFANRLGEDFQAAEFGAADILGMNPARKIYDIAATATAGVLNGIDQGLFEAPGDLLEWADSVSDMIMDRSFGNAVALAAKTVALLDQPILGGVFDLASGLMKMATEPPPPGSFPDGLTTLCEVAGTLIGAPELGGVYGAFPAMAQIVVGSYWNTVSDLFTIDSNLVNTALTSTGTDIGSLKAVYDYNHAMDSMALRFNPELEVYRLDTPSLTGNIIDWTRSYSDLFPGYSVNSGGGLGLSSGSYAGYDPFGSFIWSIDDGLSNSSGWMSSSSYSVGGTTWTSTSSFSSYSTSGIGGTGSYGSGFGLGSSSFGSGLGGFGGI